MSLRSCFFFHLLNDEDDLIMKAYVLKPYKINLLWLHSFQNFDEKKAGTPTVDFSAMSDIKATHKARITDIHWLLPSVQVN